jgi:UDPglucose 6-dehydrogenase
MRISVFGTGYVGLVTGVCFAEMGNEVICADIDAEKISQLQKGVSPIYEAGLENVIESNLKEGRLTFTTDMQLAVNSSEILFIAVGTPSDINGSADLQYVLQVARTIAESMKGYRAIVVKSTVPVGTCLKVQETVQSVLEKRGVTFGFDVISNPEFLREGTAIEDCLKPSRVVVGCESQHAQEVMGQLYEPFLRNGNPLLFMDLLSSEFTKYAANAMLATKISFMNELSRVCEKVGADIEKVRSGIGTDPRVGYHFIYPGLGYGGSCFPKDVKALIKTAEGIDEQLHILQAVELTNQIQRKRFFQKVCQHFQGNLAGKKIALWGVAFKPGTDDIREAPAIDLIDDFLAQGASLSAFDPVAATVAKKKYSGHSKIQFLDSLYAALEGVDALCIATEWKQFREPNFEKMKELMKAPVIYDGRNLYDLKMMKRYGFTYHSIGRHSV